VNYAESDDDDDNEDVFQPISNNAKKGRATKRRRVVAEDSEDEFGLDEATQRAMIEDDIDDFVAPDDSDEDVKVPQKRKRPQPMKSSKKATPASSPPPIPATTEDEDDKDIFMAGTSTAQQWTYDPENLERLNPQPATKVVKKDSNRSKQKASASEPSKRHTWLANIQDLDRHSPDHPEYDPRTLYIPPKARNNTGR
jgi:DNA mismatch repair protein MSH6